MPPTLARKLRFSDAVYAIDTTPKALRNWLQRKLVRLHTPEKEGGGWIEFSFIDVAILAMVRTFVNFGLDLPTASHFANFVMTEVFPKMLKLKNPENMPAGALAILWSNARLQLYRDGDGWAIRHVALYESSLDPIRNKDFDPHLPSGVATLRREIEPAPVFVTIDVETVLQSAFDRATESVNEGQESND